ncbi:MAG: homocysteine S-methyltransferase family protein [bacterium]|nr:homocysteine S-methyltransferase family protein [bacterium]
MAQVQRLETRLRTGGPVILDGVIGTELERLGARMDQEIWCARALADSPDIVHEVHRRYIDAGADVITTNSFSATREAMQRCGLGDDFEDWNRRSAHIACEERDRSVRSGSIVVAGSVSSYGRFDGLDIETMSGHFRAQGEILVEEGVDLLILETLGSTARTVKAMVNATGDLGVPVWVSLSCVRARDTGTVMFGIEESHEAPDAVEIHGPLGDAVEEIMSVGGSAVLMMHSVRDVTEDAVKVLRAAYSGPVGAYPNAGYWTRPNWTFVDQVTPEAYLADARRWVDAGAAIVGGCCGVGPEHIRALAEGLQDGCRRRHA